jgi:hypothetical protein
VADNDLTKLMTETAARMAEAAPEGWRRCQASVTTLNDQSAYYRGRYEMADGEIREVGGELRHPSAQAARFLTVELAVESSGRFEAVSSDLVARGRSGNASLLIVLDHDAVPSDPGDDVEGPADPTFAGDPDEAVRLFRAYLRRRAEILGHEERPAEPLDPAERAALDAGLPPDLAALYGVTDGGFYSDSGIFCGHNWASLRSLGDPDDGWAAHGECHWIDDPLWRIPFDAEPFGAVRRSWTRKGWIPFAVDTGGESYLAVDMDPGPAGRPGQIILVEMSTAGPLHVADSITSLLRRHLEALDRGEYTAGHGNLRIDGLLPDGWQLDKDRKWDAADHDGSLRGMPATVQRLYADDLHLEAGQAPLLRHAALGGRTCDLSPFREIPIEALDLYLDSVDLTPLAGHPTLRAMRVGSRQPVDLGVLATLPRLEGLDLSRATAGIGGLSKLEGLLYLGLRAEQWREFQHQVGTLPSLAAVGMHGFPTPAEINEWAAHFQPAGSGHRHGLRYHTGP